MIFDKKTTPLFPFINYLTLAYIIKMYSHKSDYSIISRVF